MYLVTLHHCLQGNRFSKVRSDGWCEVQNETQLSLILLQAWALNMCTDIIRVREM